MRPKQKGRNCIIKNVGILGVVLSISKRSGLQKSLCQMSGIVPSSVKVWMEYGLEVLLVVWKENRKDKYNVTWHVKDDMNS